MVESGRVPGKGKIRATIEKLSGRVLEKGRISEYRKMVESGRVTGQGRIRASTENLSGRVLIKGRISVSVGKGRICVTIEKLSG